VACDIVPIIHGSFAAGPALKRQEKTSPNADAWCKLSRIITNGSSSAAPFIVACSAIVPKYCWRLDDLLSTLY